MPTTPGSSPESRQQSYSLRGSEGVNLDQVVSKREAKPLISVLFASCFDLNVSDMRSGDTGCLSSVCFGVK